MICVRALRNEPALCKEICACLCHPGTVQKVRVRLTVLMLSQSVQNLIKDTACILFDCSTYGWLMNEIWLMATARMADVCMYVWRVAIIEIYNMYGILYDNLRL